jgi:hypothetical protein
MNSNMGKDGKEKKIRVIVGDKEFTSDDFEEQMRKTGVEIGAVVKTAVDSLGSLFSSASQGYNRAKQPPSAAQQQEVMRQERMRSLEKAYQKTFKKIGSQKKTGVFFTILAVFVPIVSGEFAPFAVFTGLAAYTFYTVKEEETKLQHIALEMENLHSFPPLGTDETEKIILRHAFQNNGRVYPERLAIETDFSLSQIENILKTCLGKNLATLEVDESGRLFYYFVTLDESLRNSGGSSNPT